MSEMRVAHDDVLPEKYRNFARRIARAYCKRVPRSVLRADLEQAAMIGLWKWKRDHPDESTEGWRGGLRLRILGSIKDELRNQDWLPRRRKGRGECPVHVVGCDDVDPRWEDFWPSGGETPESLLERKQEASEAARALRAPMIERDAQIVQLHYFRALQFKEVANRLGCSSPRVTQIHERALGVMRAHLTGDVAALRDARNSLAYSNRWKERNP